MGFLRVTGSPTFLLSRWLFLRLLGGVYLIAFLSLAWQILGLVGEQGILPAGEYLARAEQVYGTSAYRIFPTLAWLSASDAVLRFLCWGGAISAVLLIAGIAPMPMLVLLWVTYLSLDVAGQTFLAFQWDSLLLETGLLACFYAPLQWAPRLAAERPPSPAMRWLIWWLLFRLTFLSGMTKVVSGDETWANWTALTYYYETQPIPTWTSWYVHHLPDWLHTLSVGGMFFIELLVPLLILTPPRWRGVRLSACALLVLLQFLIAATGNYGFFNLLTLVLCLTLLDDQLLRQVLPRRITDQVVETPDSPRDPWTWRVVIAAVAVVIVTISSLTFVREVTRTVPGSRAVTPEPTLSEHVLRWASPFRSINGYGLFRVMTTERPEIVIEGSQDGVVWVEYAFRWKPGDPMRRPQFVAPHQPRLDWQMWFAALDPRGAQHWLDTLLLRLLEGVPEVVALLGENPFPTGPARYVRLVYYQYHFSSASQKPETGAWWRREFLGYLTEPVSLRDATLGRNLRGAGALDSIFAWTEISSSSK